MDNADDTAELLLYGPISDTSWWGDEVTPKQFYQDLADLGNKSRVTVRVNSVGGDVFAANAILTALKTHPANVIGQVDGLAASAATVLLMGCDTIRIPPYAQMMIHNPKSLIRDLMEAEDMRKMADTLDTIKEGIISAYASKTGLDKKEIAKMMDEETWMTGEEAVRQGFADEVMFDESGMDNTVMNGNILIINSISHDLSHFKNRPAFPAAGAKPAEPVVAIQNKKQEEKASMEIKNVTELKTQLPTIHDEVYNAGIEAGRTDGARAEKERQRAFDTLNGKVDPDFLMKARYEDGATPESVLFKALQEGKLISGSYVAQAEADAAGANAVPGAASDNAAPDEVTGVLNLVKNVAERTIQGLRGGSR